MCEGDVLDICWGYARGFRGWGRVMETRRWVWMIGVVGHGVFERRE